ncbi:MAG TPA: NAD(P)-dependent oxidoreductase [Kofleriaceae bacterium]|nr:NAD(P)-dependent oxidoreductase [Kofleriaceae bacterium]
MTDAHLRQRTPGGSAPGLPREEATSLRKIGWIGAGRMGLAMATRLAKAGCDLVVYNRTRAKAEPLAQHGARIAERLADLADRDIVFAIVSTSDDLESVLIGPEGLYAQTGGKGPRIIVDCSTIATEASAQLRAALAERGAEFLAAPVSGNAKVVKAGKLSFVASGARAVFDEVAPYLACMGQGASYVGEGELSRIVKVCHNVFLGVVIQSLAEITVLAQKAGVPRHAFLEFMNQSVLGSVFSRYKTPALVNLDFAVTFTPHLLRKDLDLGLDAGRELEVPMPLASLVRDLVQSLIGAGHGDKDFASLILLVARASGIELSPENAPVGDGLS